MHDILGERKYRKPNTCVCTSFTKPCTSRMECCSACAWQHAYVCYNCEVNYCTICEGGWMNVASLCDECKCMNTCIDCAEKGICVDCD